MIVLLVFILCIVVDWLYVGWNRASLHRSQAFRACLFSGFLAFIACETSILYNANQLLMIPVVVGHMVGSYTAVKYARAEVKEVD